jgi:preprotein translocase subunit SecB
MADEQVAAADAPVEQQFAMQRIYTKDLSFESPSTPGVFKKAYQPKVNVDLNTRSSELDDPGNFEVVLKITVTAVIEGETAFLAEVQQAGIFFIAGFTEDQLRRVLGISAPNILFPYVRECIDNLIVKGGFPPIMLAPVNFEALFEQAMAQAAQQAAAREAAAAADPATH